MKIVFRADASNRMGTGHLVRCRTLAEALRARGAEISFICRDHPGSMIDSLSAEGIPVTRLPAPAESTATGEDYALWLGITQAEDAAQTLAVLDGARPDWLVVDHYGLDAEWESSLRPHVDHIMVIDDLANRRHDCNLLLDQNFSVDGEKRYADLVPLGCRLLTGPCYALLRPEYITWRKTLRPNDGRVRRVLVFLGGSDPLNVTGLALEVLSAPELRHLHVDVVVGANNPNQLSIESLGKQRPRTALYGPRPHLADLMAKADLAIGAGGTTTWERLCLGLPSLIVSIADNQKTACLTLAQAGLIHYAGDAHTMNKQHLLASLDAMIRDPERLVWLSIAGQRAVDGYGTARLHLALEKF